MTVALQQLWHYDGGTPPMNPRQLFEANLDLIERAIAQVCRQVRLHGADAEDFASCARLALLANDCAILGKYEGRSSLSSYVAIVVRRLFLDQKRTEGRWYASAEATRRGEAAVMLERLVNHDRRSLAEALEITKAKHPETDLRQLEATAAALPDRPPRPHLVPVIEGDEDRFASPAAADDRVLAAELDRSSERACRVVQDALAGMTPQDRVTLRLRFGKEMAVSDIARALGVPQRPLYRHIEALLAQLRAALQHAGIDAAAAAELVAMAGDRLDFGMISGKTAEWQPSDQSEKQ
ncbi:MAG TPA: sigma-70 family RNA polymerase sigma factor [Thermoanaerobaculia bacterium]|nr:sigma-70 family RNA polymerase sigma factor [Thermoanaerobaculia bacterium]